MPNDSAVKVTYIAKHDFWLLIEEQGVFLPFEYFSWFNDVPIDKILKINLPTSHHLYWPDLDVDLVVDSIFHPEQFPLVSQYK